MTALEIAALVVGWLLVPWAYLLMFALHAGRVAAERGADGSSFALRAMAAEHELRDARWWAVAPAFLPLPLWVLVDSAIWPLWLDLRHRAFRSAL